MSAERLEDLIQRHLDGDLVGRDRDAFEERLMNDPAAREALARAVQEDHELGVALGRPAPAIKRPARPMSPWPLAVAGLAAAAALLGLLFWPDG
ncbi:MAG: hypothetical protein KDB53_00445, partial [Planctomycetes bacterium]|nr:hypothetical protein [Planctomycetota bacterium]